VLVVTLAAIVAPGAVGVRSNDVHSQLNECLDALADARADVESVDEMIALVHAKKVLIYPAANGQPSFVSLETYTQKLHAEFVTGAITANDYKRAFVLLTTLARTTGQYLRELRSATHEARDALVARCASLRKQIDAQSSPGTTTTPASGPTSISITAAGFTVTRDIRTGNLSPASSQDVTAPQKGTVSGSVSVAGSPPAGAEVYVFAEGRLVHTGTGGWSVQDPVGSQRRVGATAQICTKPPAANTNGCSSGTNLADVPVYWTWAPA
jgi:hypothetical protein